jgi:post-segregation antitoxin (ccd killing protein)
VLDRAGRHRLATGRRARQSRAVPITVQLDDPLAEQVRVAAADAGLSPSAWVRAALQFQAASAAAQRTRAEEDAGGAAALGEP